MCINLAIHPWLHIDIYLNPSIYRSTYLLTMYLSVYVPMNVTLFVCACLPFHALQGMLGHSARPERRSKAGEQLEMLVCCNAGRSQRKGESQQVYAQLRCELSLRVLLGLQKIVDGERLRLSTLCWLPATYDPPRSLAENHGSCRLEPIDCRTGLGYIAQQV